MSLGQFNFLKQQAETNEQIVNKSNQKYIDFVRETIPADWEITPHIELICNKIQDIIDGKNNKLIITMPPRHSKTETTTIRLPCFWLENHPEQNVLITSYNERQARRFSRKCRTIYTERNVIDKQKTATDEWSTIQGGSLLARGVGSPITGSGAGLIIIDDCFKSREEADSELIKEKIWEWYLSDVISRLEPNGRIILVMTRWSEDDLIGKLLETEGDKWEVLRLPSLCDSEDDPLGRNIGEALWPQRYNEVALNEMKNTVGPYFFESVYQANPTPREGSFFKISNLEIIEAEPNNLKKTCRSWDLASSEGSGDYTAGVKLGIDKDNTIYVLDVIRGQWGVDVRDKQIRQTASLDGSIKITVPQDPGAAGKAQLLYLFRMLSGFNVSSITPTGSKQIRAEPIAAQINVGNVRLVKGAWNKEFIEELRSFPSGKNDDMIDALSDAFNSLQTTRTWTAI